MHRGGAMERQGTNARDGTMTQCVGWLYNGTQCKGTQNYEGFCDLHDCEHGTEWKLSIPLAKSQPFGGDQWIWATWCGWCGLLKIKTHSSNILTGWVKSDLRTLPRYGARDKYTKCIHGPHGSRRLSVSDRKVGGSGVENTGENRVTEVFWCSTCGQLGFKRANSDATIMESVRPWSSELPVRFSGSALIGGRKPTPRPPPPPENVHTYIGWFAGWERIQWGRCVPWLCAAAIVALWMLAWPWLTTLWGVMT